MNKPKTLRAYITRYALTQGAKIINAYTCFDSAPGMIGDTNNSATYYHGDEWHRTWESAKARAEAMRDAKIKSLKKQLAKLEAMTFEEPKP